MQTETLSLRPSRPKRTRYPSFTGVTENEALTPHISDKSCTERHVLSEFENLIFLYVYLTYLTQQQFVAIIHTFDSLKC